MTALTPPIDYFKKNAKQLLKSFAANDQVAVTRITNALVDTTNVTLMKAQHAVARESGFSKWEELIAANPIQLRLAITMAKHPSLSYFGFGVYGERKLSRDERVKQLKEVRAKLMANSHEVEKVVNWLQENILPIKTINTKCGSYSLKHIAENALDCYVANGSLIAAALILGYEMKTEWGSPNGYFGMSAKSIKLAILSNEGKRRESIHKRINVSH